MASQMIRNQTDEGIEFPLENLSIPEDPFAFFHFFVLFIEKNRVDTKQFYVSLWENKNNRDRKIKKYHLPFLKRYLQNNCHSCGSREWLHTFTSVYPSSLRNVILKNQEKEEVFLFYCNECWTQLME
jgi:hypothetical protein